MSADRSQSPDPPDAPAKLVVRPQARLWWCGGFLIVGAFIAAVGFASTEGLGADLAFVAVALACVLVASAGLRMSIVADESTVTVTNLLRRRAIPWSQLEDVLLVAVEANLDLGFHYLLFVTHEGTSTRADLPTGRAHPGGKMVRLQEALLAMKDRYAPGP